MLIDGITTADGSKIAKSTVESGTVFPLNTSIGELFYMTGAESGLYVYNGADWISATGSGGADETSFWMSV